jgi:hypothetical protein
MISAGKRWRCYELGVGVIRLARLPVLLAPTAVNLAMPLMLCYLRYPGRPLRAGERPPGPLLAFIADQTGVLPESVDEYLIAERNRRCYAVELQDRLQLRPFGTRPAAELTAWLLPQAIEDERLGHLAQLVVEECRQRRIVLPWPAALEQLCIEVRHQARREGAPPPDQWADGRTAQDQPGTNTKCPLPGRFDGLQIVERQKLRQQRLTSARTSSAPLDREFDKVHMNTLYRYGHQQAKSSHAWHKTARSRIGVVTATR